MEDVKRLGGSSLFRSRLLSENPVLSAASLHLPKDIYYRPTGDLGLVWASDIVVVAHYS